MAYIILYDTEFELSMFKQWVDARVNTHGHYQHVPT